MTKIKVSFKQQNNFDAYTWYDETGDGLQLLFFTEDEKTPPIVVPKQLFEQWLGEQGAFLFETMSFDSRSGEYYPSYKHAMASDYWLFCDSTQILSDLRRYLQTL